MKKRISILLTVLLLFSLSLSVWADTGLLTAPCEGEDRAELLKGETATVTKEEPGKGRITAYAVSETGVLAVVPLQESGSPKVVLYGPDGAFLQTYEINTSGTVLVSWKGEHLLVLDRRADRVAEYLPDGTCIEVVDVVDSLENDSYIRRVLCSPEKKVGNATYYLCNAKGKPHYSGVEMPGFQVVKEEAGERILLYDGTEGMAQIRKSERKVLLLMVVVALVLGGYTVFTVLHARHVKKNAAKTNGQPPERKGEN